MKEAKVTKETKKKMNKEKQIEEMAKDLSEASRIAGQKIMEETKAFVKEHHRYHSKNDFDTAHKKSTSELEAEYLTAKGYRKASEVAREIFEEIEKSIATLEYQASTPRKTVKVEELKAQVNWVLHEVVPKTLTELKKKCTEDEKQNGNS